MMIIILTLIYLDYYCYFINNNLVKIISARSQRNINTEASENSIFTAASERLTNASAALTPNDIQYSARFKLNTC